jgi:hypothetical protein
LKGIRLGEVFEEILKRGALFYPDADEASPRRSRVCASCGKLRLRILAVVFVRESLSVGEMKMIKLERTLGGESHFLLDRISLRVEGCGWKGGGQDARATVEFS